MNPIRAIGRAARVLAGLAAAVLAFAAAVPAAYASAPPGRARLLSWPTTRPTPPPAAAST